MINKQKWYKSKMTHSKQQQRRASVSGLLHAALASLGSERGAEADTYVWVQPPAVWCSACSFSACLTLDTVQFSCQKQKHMSSHVSTRSLVRHTTPTYRCGAAGQLTMRITQVAVQYSHQSCLAGGLGDCLSSFAPSFPAFVDVDCWRAIAGALRPTVLGLAVLHKGGGVG
jgi:hypothetical protein